MDIQYIIKNAKRYLEPSHRCPKCNTTLITRWRWGVNSDAANVKYVEQRCPECGFERGWHELDEAKPQ